MNKNRTNKNATTIIIDWDDTLFPTSWVTKNNINIHKDIDHNNMQLLLKLDELTSKLLTNIKERGKILIITNASLKWFYSSLNHLVKTEKIIKECVPVFSARDLYSDDYPNEQMKWKETLYDKLFKPIIKSGHMKNIISIGDGISEFHALTNLAKKNNNIDIYYKSLRLLPEPSFVELIDQLKMINLNSNRIIKIKKHLDLMFSPSKKK